MSAPLPFNVLFLSRANASRSIIAEAVMNRLGRGRFKGYSAGSEPADGVHPYAADLLSQLDYDASAYRAKSWTEFAGSDAPRIDFIFTLSDDGAAEACPDLPGHPPSGHLSVPDPAKADGDEVAQRIAFADTHRMIYQRLGIFANLPDEALDELALEEKLADTLRASGAAQGKAGGFTADAR
ncbi:MAG: arsenate reductase ArsC [Hyphomicrobium sp.]|uniref:arsenate reductase ArsC n=1 Tax=Hyphomicrobium sp. TaxID=82 RepID=UPI003D0FDA45